MPQTFDTTKASMERRADQMRMALTEIGDNSLVTPYYNPDRDVWTVLYDRHSPNACKAIALVLIHEGRPDLIACEACAQKARTYIEASETCHHLNWMSTGTP